MLQHLKGYQKSITLIKTGRLSCHSVHCSQFHCHGISTCTYVCSAIKY